MSWQKELKTAWGKAERVAVLGAGSILCGDDAAGMLLIGKLENDLPEALREKVLLLAGSTAPENFTGVIRDFRPDLLLLVDAAYLGIPVGGIALIGPDEVKDAGFSTHMLPFPVMLNYLQKETGCRILVLGIQPGETEFDTPPCAAVLQAVADLAQAILSLLGR